VHTQCGTALYPIPSNTNVLFIRGAYKLLKVLKGSPECKYFSIGPDNNVLKEVFRSIRNEIPNSQTSMSGASELRTSSSWKVKIKSGIFYSLTLISDFNALTFLINWSLAVDTTQNLAGNIRNCEISYRIKLGQVANYTIEFLYPVALQPWSLLVMSLLKFIKPFHYHKPDLHQLPFSKLNSLSFSKFHSYDLQL
jgi:hypothetical protein